MSVQIMTDQLHKSSFLAIYQKINYSVCWQSRMKKNTEPEKTCFTSMSPLKTCF